MSRDFSHADRLMREGVHRGIFPGAVLLVAMEGAVVFQRPYGLADLFSGRIMSLDTCFDLASLTKPLATTLVVMYLVQQGRLELDRPACFYWPPLGSMDKDQITLRHLLSHRSGLPAWRPYYLRLRDIAPDQRISKLQHEVISEPLCSPPGKRAEYSDIGFMILQWVAQAVTGQPLDLLFQSLILEPLKVKDIFYSNPARKSFDRLYAATEFCPLRGRLLMGEVHDDNAHVMGGVAGHAGLFGTVGAVWELLQGLSNADQGRSIHRLFDQRIIQQFFQPQSQSTWALGFDTPSPTNSSAGKYFRPDGVGHLGYTGTSFWMARSRNIVIVLLTNRVHPTRYNFGIKEFRPQLHNAIMQNFAR
ncbi:MAG: serine hydrolase [Desulfobacteraceae bacterium]|nr:serine hydrolase [Desulfobacteraceae bacterium]